MSRRYLLRSSRIRDVVDAHHLTHAAVARRLGLSRAYWSQLLNGHRALTPSTGLLLDCTIFAGMEETELWERIDVPEREAS